MYIVRVYDTAVRRETFYGPFGTIEGMGLWLKKQKFDERYFITQCFELHRPEL
jgi:hypothetical protein